MSDIDTLLKHARESLVKAYAPYSHFPVGSCIKTTDGNFYSGCNIENASYGLTICAERNAICQMISTQGEAVIEQVLVISKMESHCAPCGACRQFLAEFANPETIIHLCTKDGDIKSIKLVDLLPLSFGPKHLHEVIV